MKVVKQDFNVFAVFIPKPLEDLFFCLANVWATCCEFKQTTCHVRDYKRNNFHLSKGEGAMHVDILLNYS